MSDAAITAEGLGKQYRVWTRPRPTNLTELTRAVSASLRRRIHLHAEALHEDRWALRDVSFEVPRGSVLGLIGPNGAGKSTLLSILARITEPTEGRAVLRGRVSSLLEVGTGFHLELSGRDNIFLNGAVLGMSRAETARKFDEIVEFSGVKDSIDMAVKRYSTGMYMRLAFAVAAHLDPEILLVDEVLSVGDQAFQAQSLRRIEEMSRGGCTAVFVSHDVNSVARLCKKGMLIRDGRVAFHGDIDRAIEQYLGGSTVLQGGGHLDRVERDGTGELRVMQLTVTNAEGGGAIFPNQPVVIRASLAAPRPVSGTNLQLQIGIANSVGTGLVSLSTQFDPTHQLDDALIEHGTPIECVVDELPLKPGNYIMSVTLDRLGETLDRVLNQIEFTILPADFHGSGVLPSDHQGQNPVLVRHSWHVASPAVLDRGTSL
jgi:lipopolysaccharide transport system ATP-binding protein